MKKTILIFTLLISMQSFSQEKKVEDVKISLSKSKLDEMINRRTAIQSALLQTTLPANFVMQINAHIDSLLLPVFEQVKRQQ